MNHVNLARELEKYFRPGKNQDLPKPIFDALLQMRPTVAVDIIAVNSKGELLLTWRDDQWWRGWHFPGGLLRFGETFLERLEKTSKRELGVGIKSAKFLTVKNYGEHERGHDVSIVFLCQLKGKPKHGRFFAKKPKPMITVHEKFWGEVKKLINR